MIVVGVHCATAEWRRDRRRTIAQANMESFMMRRLLETVAREGTGAGMEEGKEGGREWAGTTEVTKAGREAKEVGVEKQEVGNKLF